MYACVYVCNITDDDLRSTDAPALPFQAFGALGMARWDASQLTRPIYNK